jgi:hypothetical protein
MCNLYSVTTNQEAIRALFRVINRYVGNLQPMPGVLTGAWSRRTVSLRTRRSRTKRPAKRTWFGLR